MVYNISSHFVVALVNDDWSGLTEEDETLLKAWMEDNPGYVVPWTYEEEFTRCEVCKLMSDCLEVQIL